MSTNKQTFVAHQANPMPAEERMQIIEKIKRTANVSFGRHNAYLTNKSLDIPNHYSSNKSSEQLFLASQFSKDHRASHFEIGSKKENVNFRDDSTLSNYDDMVNYKEMNPHEISKDVAAKNKTSKVPI